ncbi:MAG: hypothetical protein ACLR7U_13750 [Ruthenibacterium lactatiformans]
MLLQLPAPRPLKPRRQCPVAALENGRTSAGIEAARLAAMGAERTAVDAALARAAQSDRERDALLAAHPDIAARLVPAYTCPICQDTGRDGGEVCECVHALVRQLRQQHVNASSPLSLCSFETFALEKYPDTLVPELGLTARQHMAQVLEYCKYYAAHFSPRESTSLYLFGSAGLENICPLHRQYRAQRLTWCMSARRTR